MKNLQNLGVQELNAKEIKETDGGCPGNICSYLEQAGDAIVDTVSTAWNAFWAGYNEGNKVE